MDPTSAAFQTAASRQATEVAAGSSPETTTNGAICATVRGMSIKINTTDNLERGLSSPDPAAVQSKPDAEPFSSYLIRLTDAKRYIPLAVELPSVFGTDETDDDMPPPDIDVMQAITPESAARLRAYYSRFSGSSLDSEISEPEHYSGLFQNPALRSGGDGYFTLDTGAHYEAGGNKLTGFIVFGRTGDSDLDELRPSPQHYVDNIRLSVKPEQFQQAWECLEPLLLSDDNPFFDFKITDVDRLKRQYQSPENVGEQISRLWLGGQFIFYCIPDAKTDTLKQQAAFISKLVAALQEQGIQSGTTPVSDVQVDEQGYACYRLKKFDRYDPLASDKHEMLQSPAFKAFQDELKQ